MLWHRASRMTKWAFAGRKPKGMSGFAPNPAGFVANTPRQNGSSWLLHALGRQIFQALITRCPNLGDHRRAESVAPPHGVENV